MGLFAKWSRGRQQTHPAEQAELHAGENLCARFKSTQQSQHNPGCHLSQISHDIV